MTSKKNRKNSLITILCLVIITGICNACNTTRPGFNEKVMTEDEIKEQVKKNEEREKLKKMIDLQRMQDYGQPVTTTRE